MSVVGYWIRDDNRGKIITPSSKSLQFFERGFVCHSPSVLNFGPEEP